MIDRRQLVRTDVPMKLKRTRLRLTPEMSGENEAQTPSRAFRALLLLVLIGTAAVAAAAAPNDDSVDAVKRILLQNARGFEQGDFALLDSIWAHDETVTVFESGYANYGWEDYRDHHLKPEVEEMKNVKYELSDIKPFIDGKTAWTTFKYTISADYEGKRIDGSGLGTVVLQRRADGWKIVHWHTSTPRKKAAEPTN